MNPLRKRYALAVAVTLLLGTAACGSGGSNASGASGSDANAEAFTQAKADVDVLLSNPTFQVDPLPAPAAKDLKVASVTCSVTSCKPGEFQRASATLGWDATEETYDLAKGPADFVAAVRRALQTGPDALAILFVYPPELIKAELEQATSQGITLVDIASAIDAPPAGFISCIACNPALYADGKAEADYVAVVAGKPTSVGVVGDKTIAAHISATKGFNDQLKRVSPGSDVTEINVSFAKSPQANAQTVVSALQRDPEIEYLVFQSPDLLAGMAQALGAAGLDDQVTSLGLDPGADEQVNLLKGGGVDAWVGADGPVIWWRAVDAIARHEAGADVDPTPVPALRVITTENLQPGMFAPRDYEAAFKRAWNGS